MIVINIETYGDFDIPGTDTIMVAPETMDRAAVRSIAKGVEDANSKTRDSAATIKELKSLGFRVCTEIGLRIGGDL